MSAALGKKPTACVPCHERKVRCDSTVVGIPCTRCTRRDRADSCTLLERGARNSATNNPNNSSKRRRTVHDSNEALKDPHDPEPQPEPVYPSPRPPTPATSVPPQRHASFSHSQSDVAQGLLDLSHAGTTTSISETLLPGPHQSHQGQPHPVYYLAADEDAHLETLCLMADENPAMPSPVPLSTSEQGHQVIEYYGELNSITVLSEILGQAQRRLIRLDLPGPVAVGARSRELAGLDDADIAYLRAKHVHDFPPTAICRNFLHLFFKHIYPYTPILNRQQLMEDYERGSCSSFLLWSILANVVPYADSDLLFDSGYTECAIAQKDYFSRARLLYDFGCEKAQLNLLQGSLLLSSFQNSFAPDKDFRFWFHNAVRIALQMGFNRRDMENHLDPSTQQLVRRIWWVLYSRDIWFSVVGFANGRLIDDHGIQWRLPGAEDWACEQALSSQHKDVIPQITPLHQHFLTENCRLALLGARFLNLLGPNRPTPAIAEAQAFIHALTAWRTSFPEDLLLDRVTHWDETSAWVLFLGSMGYRLECSFYRTLRQRARTLVNKSLELATWASDRLRRCIFELDTVLKRAIVNDVARFCPPSLIICISHLLVFQLDVVLDSGAPEAQRIASRAQIHTGLAYLRAVGDQWLNAKWTFRVFDSVTKRLGITMVGERHELLDHHDERWPRLPNAGLAESGLWRDDGGAGAGVLHNGPVGAGRSAPTQQHPQCGDELAMPDRWIESLLTENLMNGLDGGLFSLVPP
ncbi:hypothetical protein BO82DRAFT_432278 [Aspergillus uvarum CBS 121591]|uniref:Zn(2)-C6 fungal-type domain-containing protein n=1 Tax=Aspergillus uvarum CBS 121591 TaxID=1448315 RepID=A0A319CDX1_9EURO|nr:hypothetical protein BO82DRAFT_432278 [Aspergillus uvarum CBS 121591]PYH81921.1 hypothetical protein BO82DRAFT_432278 [Aspergillus uvarum CBS 121591]